MKGLFLKQQSVLFSVALCICISGCLLDDLEIPDLRSPVPFSTLGTKGSYSNDIHGEWIERNDRGKIIVTAGNFVGTDHTNTLYLGTPFWLDETQYTDIMVQRENDVSEVFWLARLERKSDLLALSFLELTVVLEQQIEAQGNKLQPAEELKEILITNQRNLTWEPVTWFEREEKLPIKVD